MELWQITSADSSQLISSSRDKPTANSSIKSDYAKILAEKLATAKNDMEQMNELQEDLDYNSKLQEELTGKSRDDDSQISSGKSTDTIVRIMPDGSVRFLKIQDGEVVEQFVKKPHMVAIPDPTAPLTPSGDVAVTMKAKPQLDLFSLLI